MIILRAHNWDLATKFAYERYSKIAKTIVCFDCTAGNSISDVPSAVKLDDLWLSANGLDISCDRLTWRCGDYSFYRVYDYFPSEDYYWLIEPDVYVNFNKVNDFFDACSNDNSDFLGLMYGKRGPEWAWHKTIEPYYPDNQIYGCSFGILRLSRIAVEELYNQRKEDARKFDLVNPSISWPNDESFVVNYLFYSGKNLKNINDIVNDSSSFRTYWINKSHGWHEYDSLKSKSDNKIYHPVRGFN